MDGPKLRLSGGPLDHRPFGRLSFVNLDGPNYVIWTKEPSSDQGLGHNGGSLQHGQADCWNYGVVRW